MKSDSSSRGDPASPMMNSVEPPPMSTTNVEPVVGVVFATPV